MFLVFTVGARYASGQQLALPLGIILTRGSRGLSARLKHEGFITPCCPTTSFRLRRVLQLVLALTGDGMLREVMLGGPSQNHGSKTLIFQTLSFIFSCLN